MLCLILYSRIIQNLYNLFVLYKTFYVMNCNILCRMYKNKRTMSMCWITYSFCNIQKLFAHRNCSRYTIFQQVLVHGYLFPRWRHATLLRTIQEVASSWLKWCPLNAHWVHFLVLFSDPKNMRYQINIALHILSTYA